MTDLPPGASPPSEPRLPTPGSVLLLLLGVALLYVVGGVTLQVLFGEIGLALTQLGLLLAPALYFVFRGGYDPFRTLALRAPTGRQVLGGLLLLAGGTPIAWLLAWAQSFVIEVPTEMLEAMAALFRTDDPLRILWLLILVAAIPAVAEEFLFRGVLLSGLRTRMSRWGAVGLTGFLFGLFHLTPYTAFRFLPTAWLGLVLAWAVYESRSIWVGVLLHFLNNGIILMLSVLPATRDMASDADQDPPLLLLPVALLLLWSGARLLRTPALPDGRTPDPSRS
ncbi:MAG: CPBP family intramembrane metalloprotease [Gemmatimonadales bacterium]|nr:MAG: CPBP family intramembrane metalloprotease [Gemmatimonadales bacterium]